jgi:hypothetical protein
MDKTYVLLLFAAKPSDVYVALSKTNLEKAREYLKDKYCPRHQTNPDVAGRNRSFPSSLDKSSF